MKRNFVFLLVLVLVIALATLFMTVGCAEEAPAEPAGPSAEELLGEIRDLLKDRR